MNFKPTPDRGRWYGIAAVLALLGADVLALNLLIGRPVDGLSFVLGLFVLCSVPLIGYLASRTIGAWTLAYWVDRNAVTLVWGATRQIVPLPGIQRIQLGTSARPDRAAGIWHWPCPERRRYRVEGLGLLNAYATCPLSRQVILVTDAECYSLSPADPGAFVRALQERRALGPARVVTPEIQRPPLWTWPLWRDRAALAMIGLGVLGLVVMFGVLSFRFPGLSADLPMHFDVSGLPDRIAPKEGLFILPLMGLLVWLVNTSVGVWLYRHVQHGAAYLLWGGALAVEGIAGLALLNLMRW